MFCMAVVDKWKSTRVLVPFCNVDQKRNVGQFPDEKQFTSSSGLLGLRSFCANNPTIGEPKTGGGWSVVRMHILSETVYGMYGFSCNGYYYKPLARRRLESRNRHLNRDEAILERISFDSKSCGAERDLSNLWKYGWALNRLHAIVWPVYNVWAAVWAECTKEAKLYDMHWKDRYGRNKRWECWAKGFDIPKSNKKNSSRYLSSLIWMKTFENVSGLGRELT